MSDAHDLYLYRRKGNYAPRVGAVHDLCGYGNCSLVVAITIVSAAGCDVCPVPTSLFSANTKFPVFYMHDTTDILNDYLDAWNKEKVDLDAIYSGFLGSATQVDVIKRMYLEYPHALRIVDPVMGDDGKKYPTYTQEMCDATRELVEGADLLTPNLTEASLLTDISYEGQDVDDDYVHRMIDALLTMGAKSVVLKGVVRGDGKIRNYLAGEGYAPAEVIAEELPYMLHGTGDVSASATLAALMCGRSLYDAVDFASTFVHDAMVITREQPDYEMRGVTFEPVLGEVTDLLRK